MADKTNKEVDVNALKEENTNLKKNLLVLQYQNIENQEQMLKQRKDEILNEIRTNYPELLGPVKTKEDN